jgi:hypothetical protein
MDLQSRKIEFVQEFLKLRSEEAISRLEKLLKKEKATDFLDDLNSDQIAEIKKASLEIKEGKITDYETFMAKHR